MSDLTPLQKVLATFVAAAVFLPLGLWVNGFFYGREVGQEQSKIAKRRCVPVRALGLRGFFIWQWSRGNQLDYLGSLIGLIVGAIVGPSLLAYLVFT